jgi:hypothetical protein
MRTVNTGEGVAATGARETCSSRLRRSHSNLIPPMNAATTSINTNNALMLNCGRRMLVSLLE